MKGTADFYNRTAQVWAENGYSDESEIPSLTDFVKQFPKGSRFLDLCCGTGYESKRIHELGYDVVGIDFSVESIKIAKERNPDIDFYCDDILSDYSYVGKADAVIVIAGLVHIETEKLHLAFTRMRNILNENGRVYITVKDGKGKIQEKSIATIDGEEYDRNFISHTLDELTDAACGLFEFEREADSGGTPWRNYIFKCVSKIV